MDFNDEDLEPADTSPENTADSKSRNIIQTIFKVKPNVQEMEARAQTIYGNQPRIFWETTGTINSTTIEQYYKLQQKFNADAQVERTIN